MVANLLITCVCVCVLLVCLLLRWVRLVGCGRFGVCLLFALLLVLILWLLVCYCVDWFLAADCCFIVIERVVALCLGVVLQCW